MIYLYLEGHEFQYAIEEVLKLFFQDETICAVHDKKFKPETGFLLCSIITDTLNTSISDTEGNVLCSFVHSLDDIAQLSCGEEKRSLKKEIKRQVYKALAQYTHRNMPWGVLTGIRPAKLVHEMIERGLDQAGVFDRLTNHYFASPKKAKLLYEVALAEKSILDSTADNTVGVYIGIPFCPTRCLYCSFTSNPIKKYEKWIVPYMQALAKEIRSTAKLLSDKRLKVESIYIGGGTPTSIEVPHLKALLNEVENSFCLDALKEYTLEAGRPDSITLEKLQAIADSKVDRISINPQTMNDQTLLRIGRSHSATDIVEVFKLARGLGFDNINMDLIAGLPGEKLEDFLYTLDEIKKLGPESITVHTMSIKRASRLNEEKTSYSLTTGAEVEKMVDAAYAVIRDMGLSPYYLYRQKNILGNLENIGYAKPQAESVYNVQIMEEKQTIVALGAGATTKVVYPCENRIERIFNVKSVEEYVSRIDEMIARKTNMPF